MQHPQVLNLPPLEAPQVQLRAALQDCRQQTLARIKGISPDGFRQQAHAEFSPVGWHLGHIAYTESMWIAGHLAQEIGQLSQYKQLFAADGLPKAQRQNLPSLAEILAYLAEVRSHTLTYLQSHPPHTPDSLRLWHWLVQHESQHAETISIVLAMHHVSSPQTHRDMTAPVDSSHGPDMDSDMDSDMVWIAAGEFRQGSDADEAIDNERPAHVVSTDSYWLDRTPVTCGQYRNFIEAGGYHQAKWWCEAGWQWQQSVQLSAPLYWPLDQPLCREEEFNQHPVCGVSWYEADAYARFIGKRLPTEAEWEKAAQISKRSAISGAAGCQHLFGNVWEWTNSWFSAYPGFRAFPYAGYSQAYFDGAHRVLRGSSWASGPAIARTSFRNWYEPHRRELFAGFRCAV